MKPAFLYFIFVIFLIVSACTKEQKTEPKEFRVRQVVDTVGFAHLDWQMDSVLFRIDSMFKTQLEQVAQSEETVWRTAICPHDDYTYTSWLYPAVLKNLKAKTIIIFGVAHKARDFGLEDKIVFDRFDAWHGPYGNVNVSSVRDKIIEMLPEDFYVVHDSMQIIEHSVESMIPFLQNQNKNVEIISILVPYMSRSRMDTISVHLASALQSVAKSEKLKWGKDFALLITTDAVHYGCEDWGGKDYAPFGCNSAGYEKAIDFEHQIIMNCFTGNLTNENANMFYNYTVQPDNYKEYKWTWCGRYSVPLGLKVAVNMQKIYNTNPLEGIPLAYETSINHPELPVSDLRMGKTAVAKIQHWVGYAAVGFE